MRAGTIGVDEANPVTRLDEIVRHRHGGVLADPAERSADGARVTEVVAHQVFDLLTRRAGVAHHLGGVFLHLVIQDVLVALVLQVQHRAQAQEKLLGFVEAGAIGRAAIDQRRVGERRDRARGPQIANGARRVLGVGLELVERVVEARVPLVDETIERAENTRVRGWRTDPRGDAIEQRRVAGDGARVEQSEQEFRVVDLELGEVVHLPDLVAH